MAAQIDTFLFDMGNVLVHFSHPRMCDQLAALCGCDVDAMRHLLFEAGFQGQLERGELTEEGFLQHLSTSFQCELELERLTYAAADIFTLNEPMVPLLKQLKALGKRLVLLSNTSLSHIRFVQREYRILDDFDDLVLSYEVGAMKPDAAIFEAALARIQCPPERCFYTDDIEPYVQAGRRFGLQAEVFTTAAALRAQLAARGFDLPPALAESR